MPQVAITTEPLYHADGPHLDILKRAGFEIVYPSQREVFTEDDTIRAIGTAEAVLAGGEPYSRRVLSQLPRLRVISRMGVGYDRVDVAAVSERNIVLTITPAGNHEAVAEHTLALLLALTRSIVKNDRDARQGIWGKPRLVPLRGQTLGIVGLGRIGRSVAHRARSFGLRILATDVVCNGEAARQLGIEFVDLDTLLSQSDFVTLHVPLLPETARLIDRRRLERMKPGSYLINTARGGLVVEEDLLQALNTGHLAGAGFDALADEPPPADHPFLSLDNVVISPHVAASDSRAVVDMAVGAAQNIVDLYRGKWPAESVINPDVKPRWRWEH